MTLQKIVLILITDKWLRLVERTRKRKMFARALLGESSAQYQALRRVELALKTADPLIYLTELNENAIEEMIDAASNQSDLLQYWIAQQEIYEKAIDELKF